MAELSVDTLIALGFVDVGAWVPDGAEITYLLDASSRTASEVLLDASRALYAFVTGDNVQYIGKTARTIRRRFVGYRRPGRTQQTNLRCNRKIREALAEGTEVRILLFSPISQLRYLDFEIDLAAGLEDSLISEFRPPWNGGERGRLVSEEAEREEAEEVEVSSQPASVAEVRADQPRQAQSPEGTRFTITLGAAYYDHGFINPGVGASQHLGADGEPIQVLFDDGTEPVVARINRTANRSGGVRVVGRNKLIAHWFQDHFSRGDTVEGLVLDQNRILLVLSRSRGAELM